LVIFSPAASFGWLIYHFLFGSSTVRSEAAIARFVFHINLKLGYRSVNAGNLLGSIRAALGTSTRDYIPISLFAITILRYLLTIIVLYICCLVVLDLEFLVFLPFLIKQRAYSLVYQELATPRIGPIFLLQLSEYFLDLCETFIG
jgi:hypothetical protein